LIEPIKPALTTLERNAVETKVKEATALCNTDKYSEGYTVTAKLARFIGQPRAIAPTPASRRDVDSRRSAGTRLSFMQAD
jgi:hypothetical protein